MGARTQASKPGAAAGPGDPFPGALAAFGDRLSAVEQAVTAICQVLGRGTVTKESYSTAELAEAMGVSTYTVAERWCNAGRIKCMKDPVANRWRIPADEYRRLVAGGSPRAGSH